MMVGLRYQPSREQIELIEALEGALAAILPVTRLRHGWHESEDVWSSLEELGLFDLAVEEAQGGSGLGATEEALMALALGRQLASPAIFATLGAAHVGERRGRPPRIAAGLAADWPILIEEPGATAILVRYADTAELRALPNAEPMDSEMWAARLMRIEGDPAPLAMADATGLIRLRLIDAAALAGIAGATLDMAVDYAKMREQFGRAIGSFQAVKHHCATMAIAACGARDIVTFAAVAIDEGRADAAMRVESAFLIAASAAIDNAGTNIQIHGGIGFSEEADPHLYLKRAQLLAALGGGIDAATVRLATVNGLGSEVSCRLQ